MSGRLSLDRVSLHLSRLTIQGPSLNPKPPASSAHSGRVRFQQIALGQHAAQIRSQTAFEDEDDDEYEDDPANRLRIGDTSTIRIFTHNLSI